MREEVLAHQADVELLSAQLEKLEAEAQDLDEKRSGLEAELANQERRLASEGGGYAARRTAMQDKLKAVQAEAEEVSEQLRELCAELLPFALAPELCEGLALRLEREAETHRCNLAGELWDRRVSEAESVLHGEELWGDLRVPDDARAAILDRLMGVLRGPGDEGGRDESPFIHRLSDQEHERLRGWTARASKEVPEQTKALSGRLRELQVARKAIERELQRAPDEDTLDPISAEIARTQEALDDLRDRRAHIDKRIGELRFRHEEKGRELEKAAEQLSEAQAGERQMVLAERSKRALRAYEDALARQQVSAIEEELTAAFNMICRKEHLLTSVRIDPESFRIRLHGADGGTFLLGDFSAGERQLYVLALLWALRRVSGRRLPLAVDTPLARLDEVHRGLLLHSYVPAVSDQVVLFTTDAELDSGMLADVEPYLSRVYRLRHDADDGSTSIVETERPNSRGILLYERAANGHGPQGGSEGIQVWGHEPDRTKADGREKRALLSDEARRLTLFDTAEGGYDWSQVAEFERLTGTPYLSGKLRAGAQLGELWHGEWAKCLLNAGYDSVFAPALGSMEEYVVNPDVLLSLGYSEERNGASP